MHANPGKRITTRVTGHVQEKLQVAAEILGATLNQFVVQAALEKAEKVIESESTIVLTRREAVKMLKLIENPPPMNKKLRALMADLKRRKKDGSDSSFEWTP